jgi:hypothetical protein
MKWFWGVEIYKISSKQDKHMLTKVSIYRSIKYSPEF